LNGSFRIADFAAFLGYQERATEGAITEMIRRQILKHHKNNLTGRFEITDQAGLEPYIKELKAAEEKKRRSGRRKQDRNKSQPL